MLMEMFGGIPLWQARGPPFDPYQGGSNVQAVALLMGWDQSFKNIRHWEGWDSGEPPCKKNAARTWQEEKHVGDVTRGGRTQKGSGESVHACENFCKGNNECFWN